MALFGKKAEDENVTTRERSSDISLGERIAEGRKRCGYTQEEFSAMLGITPQAVSKWENDVSYPDIMLLPKIADIFGISVDELLKGKKHKDEPETIVGEKVNDYHRKSETFDDSKLKFIVRVLKPNQKPICVTLPFAIVKRVVSVGIGISGIIGNDIITKAQLNEIFALVDEGVTGKILDIVTEDDTNVIIEIV